MKVRLSPPGGGVFLAAAALLAFAGSGRAVTHYVDVNSHTPMPPYTGWATAATSIQQAVGAAAAGDKVVVTNGVYAGGVVVTNPLALLSVNGPQFTVINEGATNRCASLTNGASLSGFTLTNGFTAGQGGGVLCSSMSAFLTNCVFAGNSATNSGRGGGAGGGTLYNCTLTGNSAEQGGGASFSTLYNCTLTGNSAVGSDIMRGEGISGGAAACTLYNCTLARNS